jgi:hypothetical protein
LIDQPVVVGEHRATRIRGMGTALRHLPHAKVRPVGKVEMTAALRHDLMLAERIICSAADGCEWAAHGRSIPPNDF